MTIDELKSCLNGIDQELMQNNYDDAFILLNTLVGHAVRCGYKLATVAEFSLTEALERIDRSTVIIGGKTTVLVLEAPEQRKEPNDE